jgi:transposase
MDKAGCCCYLRWLKACYPNDKLGLIWDAASSHFSEQVMQEAADLGITLAGIPPGCTSLIQVCDLLTNKPLKQAFKKRYVSWKIRSDPGPGGKYKLDRDNIICWLEDAFEEVNVNLSPQCKIAKAFATYGQDHRSKDQTALHEYQAKHEENGYLAKHEENGIYKSLIEQQKSLDLD